MAAFPTGRKKPFRTVSNCPKSFLRLRIPLLVQEGARELSSNRRADLILPEYPSTPKMSNEGNESLPNPFNYGNYSF
jgi:hypothetical protein